MATSRKKTKRPSKEDRQRIENRSFTQTVSILEDMAHPELAKFGQVRSIQNELWIRLSELNMDKDPDEMHLGLCVSPGERPMMAFGTSRLENRDWSKPWLFLVERSDAPFLERTTLFLLKYRFPITLGDIYRKPNVRGTISTELREKLLQKLSEYYASSEFSTPPGGTK